MLDTAKLLLVGAGSSDITVIRLAEEAEALTVSSTTTST